MSEPLHILHLEDRAVDAELVSRELQRVGIPFTIRRVWTERDFLDGLRDPDLDIIFCDYVLPGYDGLSALAATRRERPNLPFLFVSGTLGEEKAIEALHLGATDYVLKHGLNRLGPSLRRALRELEMSRRQEQTMAALRESETRFQQVTGHLGEWVWEVDANGLYTYSSRVVERILGYHPGDLVGKLRFYDLYPPDRRENLKELAFSHFRSKRPFIRFKNYCVHRDSHLVLLETSGTPILDSHSRLIGYRGVDSDITERERTEEQIRSQARLLDLAQDAIVVRDMNGVVQYWNKSYERLTGWTAEEAIGRSILELVRHNLTVFDRAMRTVLKDGCWTGELVLTARDGHPVTVMSRWTLVRDEEDRPKSILAINTDVTERKKVEAQFLRAQRLEGIGALASGLAHDLNNILSPILMTAPMLRNTASDPDTRAMLETIENCAHRGAAIIRQLLAFARGKPDVRAPLPLRHLLNEMKKIIAETFPRDIDIRVDAPKDLWPLMGDSTQVHQVLMNLCVNARDAMLQGGTLCIEARNATVDRAVADATLDAHPGPYVCVRVADTGSGIAPEYLNRIFDPFFTTKEVGRGTGLGLATVLGIIRGHEGFVRVESKLGEGTTFEIYFPASPEAESSAPPVSTLNCPRGDNELILVVDDETAVSLGVRRILEKHGYRVLTAANGAQGLELFAQHRGEIRVVLTDMMMPVMNGLAMIAALQQTAPSLPIICMTGLAESETSMETTRLNLPMLQKPFTIETLLQSVRDTLHPAPPPEPAG